MPCGRCRQLLWENGGASLELMTARGVPRWTTCCPTPSVLRIWRPSTANDARHDAVEVISAKRDRRELTGSQIDWVVDAYTVGVADQQMPPWRWRSC